MFFTMIFSIGEMSAAMPHTGGAYSFSRAAMGPWGGFVTGLRRDDRVRRHDGGDRLVLGRLRRLGAVAAHRQHQRGRHAAATGCGGSSSMSSSSASTRSEPRSASASRSSSRSSRSASSCSSRSRPSPRARSTSRKLFDIAPTEGNSSFLPFGGIGILFALPFAIWFFLGIEELPLAAEESHDPAKDIPKAGVWGVVTLAITGLLVLFLNPAVTGTADLTVSPGLRRAAARRASACSSPTASRRSSRCSR